MPNDPRGQDDVLIAGPELHLPLDRPVKVLLRSKDVLHDFTVPQFRVKMDLVPGMVTYLWLTPTRTGAFEILCEELCGLGHFAMRGRVVVDDADAYQAWLAGQPTFAAVAARPAADVVAGQAAFAVCAACHGANGEGNQALNAPKLAGQPDWYLDAAAAQLQARRARRRTGRRHREPDGGDREPLDATTIDNVVAYIATLPDTVRTPPSRAMRRAGASRYTTCAYCHGAAGQGSWSTNAPRLAGMSDWYLARQLQQFRRGPSRPASAGFPRRADGAMSGVVADGEAIDDLLAYINTLR